MNVQIIIFTIIQRDWRVEKLIPNVSPDFHSALFPYRPKTSKVSQISILMYFHRHQRLAKFGTKCRSRFLFWSTFIELRDQLWDQMLFQIFVFGFYHRVYRLGKLILDLTPDFFLWFRLLETRVETRSGLKPVFLLQHLVYRQTAWN